MKLSCLNSHAYKSSSIISFKNCLKYFLNAIFFWPICISSRYIILKQWILTLGESESPAKHFQPTKIKFSFFSKYAYVSSPEQKYVDVYFQTLSSPLSMWKSESQGSINICAFLLSCTQYIFVSYMLWFEQCTIHRK